jgi:hypothetical protein
MVRTDPVFFFLALYSIHNHKHLHHNSFIYGVTISYCHLIFHLWSISKLQDVSSLYQKLDLP